MIERKERTYWTSVEIEKVVQRAAELRIANLDSALTPLLFLAQEEVLPVERHRRTIPEDISALVKVRVEAIRKAEVESQPPQVITVPVKEIEQVDPVRFLATQPAWMLIAELVGRMDRRLERLEEAVGKGGVDAVPQPVNRPASMPPSPPKEKKHRIAIVGLFKDQFGHVQSKFQDRDWLELVWIDKETSQPRFPAVDAIIVDQHSRHRWFDAAQKVVPSDKLYFADGGQSTVIQKIFDYISKQKP